MSSMNWFKMNRNASIHKRYTLYKNFIENATTVFGKIAVEIPVEIRWIVWGKQDDTIWLYKILFGIAALPVSRTGRRGEQRGKKLHRRVRRAAKRRPEQRCFLQIRARKDGLFGSSLCSAAQAFRSIF